MGKQLVLGLEEASVSCQLHHPSVVPHDVHHTPAVLEGLTDVEVLGRLLSDIGGPGAAEILLCDYRSVAEIVTTSRSEFVNRTGLSHLIHDRILLAAEVGSRVCRAPIERINLESFSLVQAYLQSRIGNLPTETFRVLFLDTKNQLIADEAMWRGTINHCPAYTRDVVRRALELHASGVILSHNHPSGDCAPSQADLEVTVAMKAACKALSIRLLDHIIVGRGKHYSFVSNRVI